MKMTKQELDYNDLSNFITAYSSLTYKEIFKAIVTKNEYKSTKYENLMHDIFMEKFKHTSEINIIIMRDFLYHFLRHYKLEDIEFPNYLKSIEFELSKTK